MIDFKKTLINLHKKFPEYDLDKLIEIIDAIVETSDYNTFNYPFINKPSLSNLPKMTSNQTAINISDKSESGRGVVFSWQFFQNPRLFGGTEIAFCQLLKGRMNRPGTGYDHNIPAGLELVLIKTIDFTQSSADTVAHICLTQFFANGNAHPVGGGAVFAGIEHQITVCLSVCPIQTLEYVVELE